MAKVRKGKDKANPPHYLRGKAAKAKVKEKMDNPTSLELPGRTTNNQNHLEQLPEEYRLQAIPTQHHAANGSPLDTAQRKTRKRDHALTGISNSVGFG